MCGKRGLQMRCAQDPTIRSQPNFQGTQKTYRGNFLYRLHVCYYHRSGARAMGLCCWVMKISHFQHKKHTGTRETHQDQGKQHRIPESTALRVSPAVTRLTVDRRTQVHVCTYYIYVMMWCEALSSRSPGGAKLAQGGVLLFVFPDPL